MNSVPAKLIGTVVVPKLVRLDTAEKGPSELMLDSGDNSVASNSSPSLSSRLNVGLPSTVIWLLSTKLATYKGLSSTKALSTTYCVAVSSEYVKVAISSLAEATGVVFP